MQVLQRLRMITVGIGIWTAAAAAAPISPDTADGSMLLRTQASCLPNFTAEAAAGAMVRLSMSASCQAGSKITIHHNGLMITEVLDAAGNLQVNFPALAEIALFMAELEDGTVSVATTEVASLGFYDRIALQWQGNTGLALHAFEFGAEFGGDQHIWREAPKTMDRAALGEGGFLTQLGNPGYPDGQRAEIYTFPSATVSRSGNVDVRVETEVTEGNCEQEIQAQALQVGPDAELVVRELVMTMPNCDIIGDFIFIPDLVQPLNIGNSGN